MIQVSSNLHHLIAEKHRLEYLTLKFDKIEARAILKMSFGTHFLQMLLPMSLSVSQLLII
jgi:hypothetical protein